MKNIWALLLMQSQKLAMYRGDMLIWGVSGIIQPTIAFLVWSTLISAGVETPYPEPSIMVYFLLIMFTGSFCSVWSSYFINMDINSGLASKYLVKPLSLFQEHIAWNVGEKFYKIAISAILMVVFVLLNLKTVSQFELNWISVLLSLICLFCAFFIHFYLDLIVGILTFWTHDNDFLRNLNFAFASLFSGVVIPVVFLPSLLQNAAVTLPYRYTLAFPAEVFLNRLSTSELILGLTIQTLWLIALVFGYQYLYKKGTKRYQSYGS